MVFAPKYRRKVFYEEKRLEIGAILRELCLMERGGNIEAEVCPDLSYAIVDSAQDKCIRVYGIVQSQANKK